MATDKDSQIILSIVVPFHNEERNIRRCIDSLLRLDNQATQCVFVNDGSTDRSLDIVNSSLCQFHHSSTIVINHASCEGLPTSSYDGICAATGRYVVRCDADDYLDDRFLDSVLPIAKTSECDILEWGMAIHRDGNIEKIMPAAVPQLNTLALTTINFSLCNRAIRRQLLVDTPPYVKLNCWEDLAVTSRIYAANPSVERISEYLYHYIISGDKSSLTLADNRRILNDHIAIAQRLDKDFKDKNIDYTYADFLDFLKFTAKVKMLRHRPRDFYRWKTTFPEVNKKSLKFQHVGPLHRLLFFIVSIMPLGVARLMSPKNRTKSDE